MTAEIVSMIIWSVEMTTGYIVTFYNYISHFILLCICRMSRWTHHMSLAVQKQTSVDIHMQYHFKGEAVIFVEDHLLHPM